MSELGSGGAGKLPIGVRSNHSVGGLAVLLGEVCEEPSPAMGHDSSVLTWTSVDQATRTRVLYLSEPGAHLVRIHVIDSAPTGGAATRSWERWSTCAWYEDDVDTTDFVAAATKVVGRPGATSR